MINLNASNNEFVQKVKECSPVSLNVVVIMDGINRPEILPTPDEDLAKMFYLEKDAELDEDEIGRANV